MAKEAPKAETNVILVGSSLNLKLVIKNFPLIGLNFAEVTGQSFNGVKFVGKRSTENIEKRNRGPK